MQKCMKIKEGKNILTRKTMKYNIHNHKNNNFYCTFAIANSICYSVQQLFISTLPIGIILFLN